MENNIPFKHFHMATHRTRINASYSHMRSIRSSKTRIWIWISDFLHLFSVIREVSNVEGGPGCYLPRRIRPAASSVILRCLPKLARPRWPIQMGWHDGMGHITPFGEVTSTLSLLYLTPVPAYTEQERPSDYGKYPICSHFYQIYPGLSTWAHTIGPSPL